MSGDGRVDLMELLDYVELKNNAFARRTFSIFDEDKSGTIDFREFVLSLWNFCSCTDAALRMFAFDLYDSDSSGKIEAREVEMMLRDVYGEAYEASAHASRLTTKVHSMCSHNGNSISIETFIMFARDNPATLFPAFEMQRKLQMRFMGVPFWAEHLERRVEICAGSKSYVSVKQILEMKTNKSAFAELVEKPLEADANRARELNVVVKRSEVLEVALGWEHFPLLIMSGTISCFRPQ